MTQQIINGTNVPAITGGQSELQIIGTGSINGVMKVGNTPTITMPTTSGQNSVNSNSYVETNTGEVLSSGSLSSPPTLSSLTSNLIGKSLRLVTTAYGYGTIIGSEPIVRSAWTTAIADIVGSLVVGYQASTNEGVDGQWFVSNTGSDTNSGSISSPFATIAKAISVASSGDTIRVRGGKYRETVDLSSKSGIEGKRTTLARYGNEQVIISGASILNGWIQCDSTEQSIIGNNYASIYKTVVSKSSIASGDPRAAFLFEAGNRMGICAERVVQPIRPLSEATMEDWQIADEVILSADSEPLILGYRRTATTSTYTASQIARCDIAIHRYPNVSERQPVGSCDGSTIYLSDQTLKAETNENWKRFMLLNLLPAMRRGEWGYLDTGDGNVTIYCWPADASNLNGGIEYSVRSTGITFGTASHVEVRGLIVEKVAASGGSANGQYGIYGGQVGVLHYDLVINNCLVRDTYRAGRDYGAITLRNITNARIIQCTVQNAWNQFGIYNNGQGDTMESRPTGGWVDRCVISNSEDSPIRIYGQSKCAISHCRTPGCGLAAHANKGNFYQQCHKVIFYGMDFTGANGYVTHQQTSCIGYINCLIPCSNEPMNGRALVDQNSAKIASPATALGLDGTSYLINCSMPPFFDAVDAMSNSVALGVAEETAVNYIVKNNIIHGVSSSTLWSNILDWKNNLFTAGTKHDNSDQTALPRSVWTNLDIGDLSISTNSPIKTAITTSVANDIAAIQSWGTPFNRWGTDINGNAYDLNAPPMGPSVDYTLPTMSPIWITNPSVSGTPLSNSVLTVSQGYVLGNPYPTRSYQWQKSIDGVTWVNIANATNTSYTLLSSDVGYLVGCLCNAGGATVRVLASAVIASSFPISDPVLMSLDQDTATTSSIRTLVSPTFTTSGKPLFIAISTRNSTSADNTLNVTVGTPAGVRQNATFVGRSRRTSGEIQIWMLKTPTANTGQTVEVTSTLAVYGTQIATFEINGFNSVGAVTVNGLTSVTSLSSTITTTASNSIVMYVLARQGVSGGAVTLSGATQLSNMSTGGVATTDMQIVIGTEKCVTVGSYDATTTWGSSATASIIAVELKS